MKNPINDVKDFFEDDVKDFFEDDVGGVLVNMLGPKPIPVPVRDNSYNACTCNTYPEFAETSRILGTLPYNLWYMYSIIDLAKCLHVDCLDPSYASESCRTCFYSIPNYNSD